MNWVFIGWRNILSPLGRYAIIWIKGDLLASTGTNMNQNAAIFIHNNEFETSSEKGQQFYLGLNMHTVSPNNLERTCRSLYKWQLRSIKGTRCFKPHTFNAFPLDKMAAILAADNSKCILFNKNCWIPIRIARKFVPKNAIDNNSALVQILAWHRRGDKPLPEPMLTQITDAYIRHWGEMNWCIRFHWILYSHLLLTNWNVD